MTTREGVIASRDETLAYIEQYVQEDDALVSARQHGQRVVTHPINPASGASLRFLATAIQARAIVEIGTGCGSSGVWLLRGMRSDGILTSVDIEPEYLELARGAYREAGFAANRARLITGRAMEVLPRLTDAAYDMVFLDAHRAEYAEYFHQALRLLRSGGIMVFNSALAATPVPDGPLSAPGPETTGIREATRLVREDERLVPMLVPVGEGLLAAIKQSG